MPPAGIQVTDIGAIPVIPHVEPRTVQENEPVDGSQLMYIEQGAPVDECAGPIVRKDNLHQGAEALSYLGDARFTGRLLHVKPVGFYGALKVKPFRGPFLRQSSPMDNLV
ncbi:hypothetical protein, partial [Caballeronia calidae]|uniref:hypothetical protein n=1 Tax=Caballeronia calidae TaxID=1777139 RepID=UPI001E54A1AF